MWYVIVFIAGFILGTKFGPWMWNKFWDKFDDINRNLPNAG